MAYDRELAERLRELLAAESGVSERAMFGGLAFMVDGHMTVAAGPDGLLLRVAPAQTEDLIRDPQAARMEMRGRPMTGWLRVQVDADDPALPLWVGHGLAYVRTLPAKT